MVTQPVFRAISDPTRRAILDQLRAGPIPVNSVAELFPISRPAVSKHLRILREAGLVSESKQGRERLYSLEAAPLGGVHDWLGEYRRFWRSKLSRLKTYIESES